MDKRVIAVIIAIVLVIAASGAFYYKGDILYNKKNISSFGSTETDLEKAIKSTKTNIDLQKKTLKTANDLLAKLKSVSGSNNSTGSLIDKVNQTIVDTTKTISTLEAQLKLLQKS
jgi:hypothetical protein